MRLMNASNQAVYYNSVQKHGETRFIVKAASGQTLLDRDKKRVKSRSFTTEKSAEQFLKRWGYTIT